MDTREKKIMDGIQSEKMLDYAQRLIRSRDINPPADYSEIYRIVHEEMKKIGLEVETFEGHPGKINVFSILRGTDSGGQVLCLSGHMDVVPAGDESAWKYPPFAAEIHDGKIWGRGSADMKCALAAKLYALEAIKRAGIPLRGSVMVGNTVDDETAGIWGMKYMLERGLASKGWPLPSFHVVGEANHLNITASFKGRLWLRITTKGKAAHGGAPENGINAVDKMIQLISKFREIPRGTHPLTGKDTLNLGILKGGTKVNIVPADCEAHFDFRMGSPADTTSSLRWFQETIHNLKGEDPQFEVVDFEFYERRDPVEVDFAHPALAVAGSCIQEVTGKSPAMGGTMSAGDAYHSLKKGIPGIFLGPGDSNVLHQTNEFLDVQELNQAAKVYALLILRLCT
jgi:succinyl-diaminopimelate desuccinylase